MNEWWRSAEVRGGGGRRGERESLLKASTQPTWPDVTGLAKLR